MARPKQEPRVPAAGIIAEARDVLRVERRALDATSRALDERFEAAMRLLRARKGKIVVTGVGKSGLTGQKMVATFNSTGTLAVYMHAADAAHGDLGVVAAGDVVLALSHSGETEEVLSIVPFVQRLGAKVVALTGEERSNLARMADAMVILSVPEEADHLRLAPTSSALAQQAIGDAMAVLLSKWRRFRAEDFHLYHPGGQLGRRLLLRVRNLMRPLDQITSVAPRAGVNEVIEGLMRAAPGAGYLGVVFVLQSPRSRMLAGIITDGDLRRALVRRREEVFALCAEELMTRQPTTIAPEAKAEEALRLMEDRPGGQLKELPVVGRKGEALGLLRLHDLLQIGFHSARC